MNKITNFLRQVTARFKGDADALIASKNERKGESAIKGQLAALEAKRVDDESRVEDAKEAYKNALYPTVLISDNQAYVKGIVYAKEGVDNAESALASTTESIEFFKGLLVSEWSAE